MTVTTEPQSKEVIEEGAGKVGKIEEAGANGDANHENNVIAVSFLIITIFIRRRIRILNSHY